MTCPDRPHDLDNGPAPPAALCIDQTVAERIAVLIDRHGLVDVLATPAAAVCARGRHPPTRRSG
jgi:hypothetical protein